MNNNIENYLGEKVYKCKCIGGRLNLDWKGYSFCHFFEVGSQKMEVDGRITPEKYLSEVAKKIEQNFLEDAPCRKCSRCSLQTYEKEQITFVTICTTKYCNSDCVYCNGSIADEGEGTNPLVEIKAFHEAGMFAENCLFDWGGGEPTLSPFFEETVCFLEKCNYQQRINTNAILFSNATYDALKRKKCSLRISVDSGTESIFKRVKGTNKYKEVWENIERYAQASDEVYIKYNIFHWNSDFEEADAFLDNCVKAGIKHIYVESEHNAYGKLNNVGPFFFGEQELKFAKYLYSEAQKRGIEALIATGFNDRAVARKNVLPDELVSNVDYESIKNGIIPETYATVGELVRKIGSKEVLIWGAGYLGKKVKNRLDKDNVRIAAFIDQNKGLQKDNIEGIGVISPEEAAEKYKDCVVILAGKTYETMVSMMNKYNWFWWKGKVFYLLFGKYR